MAEMDNFAEINENFDTVKTLLNSIRAQGILNTSDVDKLLSGINSKLEKINTEEDIDLIKIFLSELKQNLDERHSVLVSKFGAIESLFSNLLKNSAEAPKSSEIKELFDIVATNLSVFSREVVSQKESLTDIALRIDALRSDDSQKKDIIKNISILKNDLERLTNGFDSIVISLNENFKTVVKTITTIDKTEYLDKFADSLNSIENSSNTVLSALQMLDKKTEQVEHVLSGLANKDDLDNTTRKIVELSAQSHDLTTAVNDLADRYQKFDSLSEKIDASVNVIAGLKSVLEETDDTNTRSIIEELAKLEAEVLKITSDTSFNEFKLSLEILLSNLSETVAKIDKNVLAGIEESIKKLAEFEDINVNKILVDISSNADLFSTKLTEVQSDISKLCERNFSSIYETMASLKTLISQIDDNSTSANNAIFSSITDRLTAYENSLKESLELQEKTIYESTTDFSEHFTALKNLTSVLDYKMDSSVVEIGNVKTELSSLKTSVDNVLALDFVNAVSDFRIDLYASKQEIVNSIENSSVELSDKFTNDLFSKYELLVSKLDSVEDEVKKVQLSSMTAIKTLLDNISSSLVDVISYVSERNSTSIEGLDAKFIAVTNAVKENNLDYIENVKDIVEVIRIQVDNNIKSLQEVSVQNFDSLKKVVSENTLDLKNDIKYSYSKLLELQDAFKEINALVNENQDSNSGKFENLLLSADSLRNDIDNKISTVKTNLLDKIAEFKKEFTVENAEKMSEMKFLLETSSSKASDDLNSFVKEYKQLLENFESNNAKERLLTLEKIISNFATLKGYIAELDTNSKQELSNKVDLILSDFSSMRVLLEKVDENVDGDMTRQLSIIESNFESLISQISILFEKSDLSLSERINEHFSKISDEMQFSVTDKLDSYKKIIEETFETLKEKTVEQSSYLQERISALNTAMKTAWEEQSENNIKQLESIAENLKLIINENIELTKSDYSALKDRLEVFARDIATKNDVLSQDLRAYLDDITKYIDSVFDVQIQDLKNSNDDQINLIKSGNAQLSLLVQMGTQVSDNTANISKDINTVKDDISSLAQSLASNKVDMSEIKELVTEKTDITSKELSLLSDTLLEETKTKLLEATGVINTDLNTFKADVEQSILNTQVKVAELNDVVKEKMNIFKALTIETSASEMQVLDSYINNLLEEINASKQNIQVCKDFIIDFLKKELKLISQNVEKETDIVIGELIEQFDLIKQSQADDVVNLTSRMEEIVNSHVYNNIEDLKAYLDVKTDNTVLTGKLDNLKIELSASLEGLTKDVNKLLDANVFTTAISDFRLANEILVNSAVDKLNDKVETFINENIQTIAGVLADNGKSFEEKLSFFDKKFVDTIVDKFEEIKLLSNAHNNSFDDIRKEIIGLTSNFETIKEDICLKIDNLKNQIELNNDEIKNLTTCFDNLRSQISNKSFDEAFQASINKQITNLENLISSQMVHLEDINELCVSNLPDIVEINALVKHSVIKSLDELLEKVSSQNIEETIEGELRNFKSDVITQFLNIFNQISFVTEQEEILDFIQDKHDELIEILSHIVTTGAHLGGVKNDINKVDAKISTLKDDINSINEKINSIITSDGDIDYVYSLQDLENDIANLRLVLNEMKENDRGQEFSELISSTNDIYALVESVKSELPTRQEFDTLTEDILSISARTNKLLLSSDESYKALQENLQDFKLVINDLDERTRNFADDAGITKIDSKLNSINAMMLSGAKTNQVFNQVFEYLAEWVDNASVQINGISDRVESLDDIDQIKSMLTEMKAKSEDNSDNVELIEALGNVFDKQIKRISSIESKLDKIIVDTVMKDNQPDLKPLEKTLNKVLVKIDEKITSQQDKIDSLEKKLEAVMSYVGEKSTEQLTKKVGGMDRQIAKLNKSIEKIASHVIEK